MAGGSQQQPTQTQTQTSQPWAAAAPHLENVMNEASRLYQDPSAGPMYFPWSTVANQSTQTLDSLKYIEDAARRQSDLPYNSERALNTLLTSGGLSAGQQGALSGLQGIASGADGLTADPNLLAAARGDFLSGNPHLQQQWDRNANKIGNNISARMAAAGRYGAPGAHQGTMAREMGDYYNNAQATEWARARGEQMGAINSLTQLANQNLANRMAATGQQLGGYQQGQQNLMTGMGMAPGVNAARYDDARMLAGVGAAHDAHGAALLQDDIQRWQANTMDPWNRLQLAMGTITGAGSQGGQSTSTRTGALNSTSPFVSGLGGALGGASLGNMLFPGVGAIPGALAGGALGFMR